MKNTFSFYFKTLSLQLIFILFFGNALVAQEPNFAPPEQNPFGLFSGGPNNPFVDLVDIDHDGTMEAFVTLNGEVHYYENNGSDADPVFVFEGTNPFGINLGSRWPWQFVDIDGDGFEELFLFRPSDNEQVRMIENTGVDTTMPNFSSPFLTNPFGIHLPNSESDQSLLDWVVPTFADIDNDGDYDLFLGGEFDNSPSLQDEDFYFLRNNDTSMNRTAPQFDSIEKNPFGLVLPPGTHLHWEIFEDLDCDGDLDMYLVGPPDIRYYYQNLGTPQAPDFSGGGLPSQQGTLYPPLFFPSVGSFLDIGGDGDMDLINGTSSEGIWYHENLTSTNFSYTSDGLIYAFTTNFSNGAIQWHWDFGDGSTSDMENPIYTFASSGEYVVCLTAEGDLNCQNTACDTIEVISDSVKDLQLDATLKLYPNPASDFLTFELVSEEILSQVEIEIFNMVGQKITSLSVQSFNNTLQQTISLEDLSSGVYMLKVSSSNKFLVHKLLKL